MITCGYCEADGRTEVEKLVSFQPKDNGEG